MPTDDKDLGEELPKVTEQDFILPYDDGTKPVPHVKPLVPDEESGLVLPQYKNLSFGKTDDS